MRDVWFPFYAGDFLRDERVRMMSMQEIGCYVVLLINVYSEGSIPSDPKLLRRLCHGTTPTPLVLSCFCENGTPGRLTQKRALAEMSRMESARSRRQAAANKRWSNAHALHMQSNAIHTTPHHTIKKRGGRMTPPTLEEVTQFAPHVHGSPQQAAKFWHYQTSKGWKVGSQPMVDWKAALRNWIDRDAETLIPKSPPKTPQPNTEAPWIKTKSPTGSPTNTSEKPPQNDS